MCRTARLLRSFENLNYKDDTAPGLLPRVRAARPSGRGGLAAVVKAFRVYFAAGNAG